MKRYIASLNPNGNPKNLFLDPYSIDDGKINSK